MEGDQIKIHKLLLPLSWFYGLGVWIRNTLFEIEVLKSRSFKLPVIAVGNITVGGAGKTPHVEYLIRLLQDRMKVAVLSRGYKRHTKGYVLAGKSTTADDIGDEPFQMYKKYGSQIHVAVNTDRCKGIERLMTDAETRDTRVVLLDDAYQHRYVKPKANILLVDYHRLIMHDALLPAGRLREQKSEKRRADIVVITKCPEDLRPMDYRVIKKQMSLYPYQKMFFTHLHYAELRPIFAGTTPTHMVDITENHNLIMLTGIASPTTMHEKLLQHTKNVTTLSYPDHHQFTARDISRLNNTFDMLPQPRLVITTEKDAARLLTIDGISDDVRQHTFALPIEVEFLLDQGREFDDEIIKACEIINFK